MNTRGVIRVLRLLASGSTVALLIVLSTPSVHASNDAYGDGAYGGCTYDACSVTLTSNGTVSVNVLPSSGSSCTIQSDSAGVTTDSTTGYTLSLSDSTTNNSLTNGSHTITAIGGSQSAPTTLTANTWGYRVDSIGGFGTGPTSAVSNSSVPSLAFAPVPTSTAGSDTLVDSVSAADPTVTTTVWYGICADPTAQAGTYSTSVTYTAVIN